MYMLQDQQTLFRQNPALNPELVKRQDKMRLLIKLYVENKKQQLSKEDQAEVEALLRELASIVEIDADKAGLKPAEKAKTPPVKSDNSHVPAEVLPYTKSLEGKIPAKKDKLYLAGFDSAFSYDPPRYTKAIPLRKIDKADPVAIALGAIFKTNDTNRRLFQEGIIYHAERKARLATNGVVYVQEPTPGIEKTYIYDIYHHVLGNAKNEELKNAEIPKFEQFIPNLSDQIFTIPLTDNHYERAASLTRFSKFVTEVDNVQVLLHALDDQNQVHYITFAAEVFYRGLRAIRELGAKNIEVKFSKADRAATIIDADMPERFALIMPRIEKDSSAFDNIIAGKPVPSKASMARAIHVLSKEYEPPEPVKNVSKKSTSNEIADYVPEYSKAKKETPKNIPPTKQRVTSNYFLPAVRTLLNEGIPPPPEAKPYLTSLDYKIPNKKDKIIQKVFEYNPPFYGKEPALDKAVKKDPVSIAAGDDDLRPFLKGIYYNAEDNVRVATNGHILIQEPTDGIKESYTYDIRNAAFGRPQDHTITETRYAAYKNAIPDIKNLKYKTLLTEHHYQKLLSLMRFQKFMVFKSVERDSIEYINGGNALALFTDWHKGIINFNSVVLYKAFKGLRMLGAVNIELNYGSPHSQALLIDKDKPGRLAVVMPVMISLNAINPEDVITAPYCNMNKDYPAAPARKNGPESAGFTSLLQKGIRQLRAFLS